MRKLLLITLSVLTYATTYAQNITTIAGGLGDGIPATNTPLNYPNGTAVDAAGNIYIADGENFRIRKITASNGIISTVAGGVGSLGDGNLATSANLSNPLGVAVDGSGNIYIVDRFNNRIRKVTASTGVISTVAGNGTSGFAGDGNAATSANLYNPIGVAVDGLGNIYIADAGNHRIRKVTASTGIITTIAGNGTGAFGGDGSSATTANLNSPNGIALDGSGNIYIADYANHRIRKVTVSTGIISTVAGNIAGGGDSGDGSAATSAKLFFPWGVALDGSGNIYIVDYGNHRIRKVTASNGIINTVAGSGTGPGIGHYGGDDSAATSANLNYPSGVAVDGSGNIYIADSYNHRIRKVTVSTGIISTVAGNGTRGFGGDGNVANSATLSGANGLTVDKSKNIYISDGANQRIRKITALTGIISTVAGNGTSGFAGDGNAATSAKLFYPLGVALDGSGNIYIAEPENYRIRKVTSSTGIINTIAGNGTIGFGGDDSAATSAILNFPTGVAVDDSGNIYIADKDNHRIRKVTALTGKISTVAGNGTKDYGGDGSLATSANLNNPQGVAVDGSGNIYIADKINNRIRKVTASTGVISTVAGNGGIGAYGGDGSVATSANLNYPTGVALDGSGNIYIADQGNNRIRKVTVSTSIITTIAGNGTSGYGGDDSTATSANLNNPTGLSVDGSGNIYIADVGNSRIRKVIISIDNNIISNSQTICAGSAPVSLAGSTPIGGTGSYTYTWLSSNTSATTGFTAIPSTNTINYSPGALTQKKWFRRHVVSGTFTDTSAAVAIIVNTAIGNDSITSASQTICSGSIPAPITATTATGGNGTTYTYKWLKSTTSATIGFVNAGGYDATQNFISNALTQNTWFKRKVTSGVCNADTTAALLVTVIPAIATNSITGSTQTICSGNIPATITATTATGGNGTTYTYKWLKSTTSATTGYAIAGGNDSTQNFISNALTQNTWFKRIVTSGTCSETTAALLVTVNNAIANNTITGTAPTICSGSIPAPITASTATGGNGSTYNYKWLKSITSATTGFANAGGIDSIKNFTSSSLTQNTWFKRKVSSGVCNADTTAALLITVNPKPAITNASTASICSGTSTNLTLAVSAPSTFVWTLGTNTGSITGASAGNGSSINQILTNPSNTIAGSVVYNVTPTSTTGLCVGNPTTITITIKPIPTTSNITGKVNTAKLDTASYSVSGLSGSVFNWLVSGATIQSGAGSNKIQVKWLTTGIDTIKVTETSNQGCIGMQKSLFVNVSPGTGMNELKANNQVIIYPNPFSETIHISLLNNLKLEKAIIYDLVGNEIIISNKNEIDASSLKSGVYLIMIVDNIGNSYSEKLMKN